MSLEPADSRAHRWLRSPSRRGNTPALCRLRESGSTWMWRLLRPRLLAYSRIAVPLVFDVLDGRRVASSYGIAMMARRFGIDQLGR